MKKISLFIYLIAIVILSAAAEPLDLTLESCIDMALENNPEFRISNINLRTAERNNSNIWNKFLPETSMGAGVSGNSPVISGEFEPDWTVSTSVNLSLSINSGISRSIKAIRLAYEKEEISLESARLNLISTVEKEFYYLITNESNLAIIEANLELKKKNYEQVLRNYNNGRASELSVLQAEINAANLEPSFKQAAADHEIRVKEFLITLGIDSETKINLNGSIETKPLEFDTASLISRYLMNRTDIRTLKKDLELLKNSRGIAGLSNRMPKLSLSSGLSINNTRDWADSLSLSLNLNLPLDDWIPGSSTSLSLDSMDDQIAQAEIRLEKGMNEARAEIINLIKKLETSENNMEISAMNIELAEKTYRMSEESFSRGLIQRLSVEEAQQSYLSSKQQYLTGQYNYLTGLINLRDALGLESLEELN